MNIKRCLTQRALRRVKEAVVGANGRFLTYNRIQEKSGQHWLSIEMAVALLSADPDFEVIEMAGKKNPLIRHRKDGDGEHSQ